MSATSPNTGTMAERAVRAERSDLTPLTPLPPQAGPGCFGRGPRAAGPVFRDGRALSALSPAGRVAGWSLPGPRAVPLRKPSRTFPRSPAHPRLLRAPGEQGRASPPLGGWVSPCVQPSGCCRDRPRCCSHPRGIVRSPGCAGLPVTGPVVAPVQARMVQSGSVRVTSPNAARSVHNAAANANARRDPAGPPRGEGRPREQIGHPLRTRPPFFFCV